MIYTVTFNPALDYVISVDHFTPGKINRTVSENMICGGKGINVSALLANLGYESTALGFVAGFTGAEIEKRAKELGFASDFIHVKKGMSRINVKMKSDEETEINGMGPDIQQEDVDALFEKLEDRGVRMVVDAEKDLLLDVLPLKPFLIKPNNHELGQMFGRKLKTEDEIIECAKELQDRGAVNVLVSMAGDGALLVAEDGHIYKEGVCRGTVKNSVGAGDSMVAGFLAGYLEKGDYEYALKLGTASGGATAFSYGIGTKELIMELLGQLQ